MKMVFTVLVALGAAIGVSTSSVSAATYNVTGGFTGGQLGNVAFDLTIDADFSGDIPETVSGLTINTLTSSVIGGSFTPEGGAWILLHFQY